MCLCFFFCFSWSFCWSFFFYNFWCLLEFRLGLDEDCWVLGFSFFSLFNFGDGIFRRGLKLIFVEGFVFLFVLLEFILVLFFWLLWVFVGFLFLLLVLLGDLFVLCVDCLVIVGFKGVMKFFVGVVEVLLLWNMEVFKELLNFMYRGVWSFCNFRVFLFKNVWILFFVIFFLFFCCKD